LLRLWTCHYSGFSVNIAFITAVYVFYDKNTDFFRTLLVGATENAGVENAIPSKLQGLKMQEWKKQE